MSWLAAGLFGTEFLKPRLDVGLITGRVVAKRYQLVNNDAGRRSRVGPTDTVNTFLVWRILWELYSPICAVCAMSAIGFIPGRSHTVVGDVEIDAPVFAEEVGDGGFEGRWRIPRGPWWACEQ